MAGNKEKQLKLNSFIIETPKSSNKRDQPSSSPDIVSPSMTQIEKQAKLVSSEYPQSDLGSTQSSNPDPTQNPDMIISSKRTETVIKLSDVVCATLHNPDFMDELIPEITQKVLAKIKPHVAQVVDEFVQSHVTEIQNNKDALIRQEVEQRKQNDEIRSLRNKIERLESRLEEQEQYSRRTSLRFNNVIVPTDPSGKIIKNFDTDDIILDICKNQLDIELKKTDIGRSHPIGEFRDGKMSVIVRFLSYRQRQLVFRNKKKLKNNPTKTFIAENLTKHRYDLINRLNTLRKNGKINSYWTHDGSVLVKEVAESKPRVIRTRQDIYNLGGEILEGDVDED